MSQFIFSMINYVEVKKKKKEKMGGEGQIDAGPESSSPDVNGRTLRTGVICTKWSDRKIVGMKSIGARFKGKNVKDESLISRTERPDREKERRVMTFGRKGSSLDT